MNEVNKRLQEIEIENFVWIIYLILIVLSFYGNSLEKKYFLNQNLSTKEQYRKITIFIFSIALIIYFYFFKDSWDAWKNLTYFDTEKKKNFTTLNFFASSLILIAGIIFLYIAISDTELETEIAFT